MPIYNLNGESYDIPDNLAKEFEKDNPNANINYEVDGEKYSIPLNQREAFLADFPNAISGVKKPAAKPAGYQPSPEDMASFQSTIRSGQRVLDNIPNIQQGINKVEQRAKQRAGLRVPQRINVGETNNLKEEQHLNPETGELEKTYITEGLHEYGDKAMAEQEQQSIEQFKRDQQYKQSLPGQLDAALQERDRINQMLAERREQIMKENDDKPFITKLLEAFGRASRSDKLPEEIDVWKDFDNDKEYNALMAAARKNRAIITALEDQQNQDTDSFWHSLATDITNGYNLSVGGKSSVEDLVALTDAQLQLETINKKRESGEKLTREEEVAETVLKNNAWDQMVQAKYGDSYGAWARAGKMTATSLDLMFDLMAMGGNPMSLAKDIYTGVSKWGAEKLGEMATKGLGKYMMKALGATLGSMVAGAEVTNTIQLPKTLGNTLKNVQGDVYYDDKGNYVFGHYEEDENGEPVFVEGGESFLGSFLDAERQGIAENASEVAGTFLEGAGPLILRGLEKVGLSKIANKITGLTGKSWYKAYSEALETMGFNGVPGEALEEYTGDIFSLIMGDPTGIVGDKNGRGGWADLDKHIDIWLGCATMGGLLNAPRMVGTGYSTAQYYRYKHAAEKAGEAAASVFDSEEWQLLQEAIDGASNEQMKNVALSIRTDENLNDEQKISALKYIESVQKMRGYNLGRIAAEREGDDDPALQQADHSYAEGYNSSEPQDMNDAKNQLEMSKFWLKEMVTDELMAQFEENPIDALSSIINNEAWTPDEKQTAIDYVNARMKYDGMLDGVRDDIEGKIEVSNATIDKRSNPNDGMVHPATLKDDKQVYIVGGNVVMDEAGTNVDVEASMQATGGDNMILTVDAETGKVEAHDINEFMTVDQPTDANQLKAEAAENIRQTTAQEAADKIDGKLAFQPGDQYQIIDEQGGEHSVQIVLNNGDGTVMATIDGAAEPIPMAMQDVQTMADAYNQAKVMQQQAEIQAERNVESASLAEENDSEGLAEQQTEEPEQQPTALDRIPVVSNEKGEPIFNKRGEKTYLWHEAPVADTADAFAEMTGGDMLMARDTAGSMIENAKQDLEKANKLKPQGRDPQSIINSRKNIAATQQQARDVVKYWQDVQSEINRRMKQAEADRIAAEQAAKTEEQRAAEAQRQAEIAAKQAEIDAQRRAEALEKQRKERNKPYAPLQRAKKDLEGYDEVQEVLNDTEPRDLAEWVSYLLRPHSLMWEDEKVGDNTVTGLQSELGLQKKDFDRIGTLLGKRKDGALPFAEVVDEIHEGLPEAMKEQYTDQDVRNALIDLFGEGDVNRMLHLAEEHRIEEAQLMKEEMDRRDQEAELDAWADAYHLTPEERESFEAFMQEPPSEPEQEIINQIIAEYEQNRTSSTVGQQPNVGTVGTENQGGQAEVQVEGAQEQGNADSNEQLAAGTEAGTDRQTVSDDNVPGGESATVKSVQDNLRQILTDAYASGNPELIANAAELVRNFILSDNEGFDGVYSEEIDDYTGTDPEMLTEQYITHATQNYYLDDDEDQEYIRTGLRKDLREAKEQQLQFQEPAKSSIQGLENYSEAEIIDTVMNYFDQVCADNGADADIVDVKIIGSRVNDNADENSDLDVLVEYTGNEREDDLFNMLNDTEPLVINGVVVDINPITEGKSGTIQQFLERNADYKKEADKQPQQMGETSSPEEIAAEEAKVNTEPTEGQKKAGNYQMGHIKVDGFDVTIENPKGSTRSGVDQNGKEWSQEMHNTYGYIRGTEGVDGDHIDVFLSDYPDEGYIYVIDQVNPETGEFDEHKVMYGFDSVEDATEAYLSNYEEGWKGLGNINRVERSEFKKWVDSSHRKTKPFAEYKSVKKDEYTEAGEGVNTIDTLDIPAEVKDQIAEFEGVLDDILKLPAVPEDEETKNKLEKLHAKLSEARRKLNIALRTLTTKQLLELKDATKDNAGAVYSHATDEIRNRQIAQQLSDTYDAGAEKQGEIAGKDNGKPAKQEDYVTANEKQPALSGVYHDPDGYGVVSDGYVLLADKKAYDKAHKGETLTVGKNGGKKIDGDYPNWKMIARDNTEGYQKAKINVDKLLDFLAGVEDKLKAQWKAEKDAKQTKMSYKDWSSYAEVFVKMPDGSIISFRPQYLKLFAQGMKQIGASEIEYLNIYNKVLATSKNGVSLVMPLARYDTWSQEEDVHRYFYDLSEGKAATKQSWNTNVAENYSNIPNEESVSGEKVVTLPRDWEFMPSNDFDNPYTGETIRGLNSLLQDTEDELNNPENGERNLRSNLRKRREAIVREINKREQKFDEWREKYNIDKNGKISLEDLSRIFNDHNHSRIIGKLFKKVVKVAEQIGLDISFNPNLNGAAVSRYIGQLQINPSVLTSSKLPAQSVARYILHELIHAVTQSTISAYKMGGKYAEHLTESQKAAAKQIVDVYYKLKDWAEKNGLADEYYVKNPHEMVANMSDPEIRKIFQSVKTEGKIRKTVWEVIKDAWHGIFSLEKDRTFETDIAEALDDLIDNFSLDTFKATRNHRASLEQWSTLKEMEKTLMGVHNIPEYKLRKVLKQGGLANPSLAVVDTKNHIHTDYGEISLIPRSSLIDARKGRNAGTFTADAWTATYPQVMKKMTNKGWDDFYKDTREIQNYEEGGEEMYSKIRMAWDSYLDGRDPSELYWWYLLDRGYKPEAVRYQNEYGADLTKEVTQLATDENGSDIDVASLPDEAIKRLAELKRQYEIQQGEEKKPVEERIAAARASMEGKNEIFRANRQKWIDQLEKYGDTLGNITSWVSKVVWAGRREGLLDVYGTTRQAQKEVQKNHASDYQAWLLEKEGKYGVEEKLFAGTDNYTGRQKWIPNTLANASKLMRKAGLNGAVGWSNLGEWIAKVAKRVTTLPEIRKERKNLNTTREQHDAFKEKWGNILHAISMKISAGDDMWSGEARLTEALEHDNPGDYIQREYGINLSKKDRNAIDKFIKEVREKFPTGYFETKFQRPVYLNEFAVAVVPDTTSPDVIAALEREGLKITTYQMDQQGNPDDENRRQAVMKAVQDEDDILFRDDDDDDVEPQNDVFYSNAQRAVENVAQEKATPEQWIKMIEKQGGFKAGEDKWLGLRDWLQTAADEGVKTVNKLQILDYIRQNQIPVEEVTYREYFDVDDNPNMIEFRKEYKDLLSKYEEDRNAVWRDSENFNQEMYEKYGEGWANKQLDEEDKKRSAEISHRFNMLNDNDLEQLAFADMVNKHGDDFSMAFEIDYGSGTIDAKEDMYGEGISDAAQYFLDFDEKPINTTRLNYTTAGLDHKREIAITVPTIEPYNESDDIHFGDAGEGRAVVWVRFGDTVIAVDKGNEHAAVQSRLNAYYDALREKYGFTDDPLSFDMTKLTPEEIAEGDLLQKEYEKSFLKGVRKVLVIDEIQSKRHQDAREKGYDEWTGKHEENLRNTRKKFNDILDELNRKYDMEMIGWDDLSANEHEMDADDYQRAEDAYVELQMALKPHGVPQAPFEKNWHEVAMKRMLRYAAEHGYDKIAWTTGQQQAERYDIGKVVNEIHWNNEAYYNSPKGVKKTKEVTLKLSDGGSLHLFVDPEGTIEHGTSEFKGKNLSEIVGKGLANKIMQNEGELITPEKKHLAKYYSLSGEDLRIGAEGMKGFYDEILPRFMNKYGKKWGVKVGTVHLPDLEQGAENMWSVDITPEMRESVMEGQPLFRLDDLEMNPRTTGEDMPWEDEEDNPIFYSNALKAVEAIKQDKATPEQWLAMIQKQGGLKAGEDKWIGLSWMLNDEKEKGTKSLTKKEILDYIRLNSIQIDETRYGDVMFSPNSMINLESEIMKSLYDGGTVEDALRLWDKEFRDNKLQEYQQGRFTVDEKGRIHTDEESMRPIEEVRKTYTTKGLSDKKEIALTVPNIEPYEQNDRIHFGDAGEGRAIAWIRFGDAAAYADNGEKEAEAKRIMADNDKFYEEHPELAKYGIGSDELKKESEERKQRQRAAYDTAHAVPLDKKVLVIDEIQSNRHQDGREQGYKGELKDSPRGQYQEALYKVDAARNMIAEKYGEFWVEDDLTEEERKQYQALLDDLTKKSEIKDEKIYSVPDAPFERNWHELAMKRMLRYAAEHGYDKIAWTTGKQQADRYNLAKAIRSVRRSTKVMGPDWFTLVPQGGAQMRFHVGEDGKIDRVSAGGMESMIGHTLVDLFGKEAAPKIEALKDTESLDFENQTIGGEGMKGFYDEILPRFLNKYGKRWGVKVEKTSLPKLGFAGQTMWSIDVTPEMRKSVLKGQPMFRLRDEQPPKKTGIGYKVFVVKDGKLYPPMVANPNGEATPVGEWLDADAAPITGTSKTGRPQVKAGGKGTQGGSGTLAYRPGWHLGTIPYASQFNRKDAKGDKTLFPKDFVWAEVEYADDVDYSEEARQEGMNANGKYQHSLAGLKRVPENGSYRYRTNPDPNTDEWIITGAMKVNRLLTPSEVDQMVRDAGREPQQRQEGSLTDEQVEALNKELDVNNKLERQTQEQEPQQKVEKKRTPAEQRAREAFAERQRRRAVDLAKETVEKLNLGDKVTILDNADGLSGRYKKAKGWYDRSTGKIVIVIDNHKSPSDVMMTILHEGVAHYGLRKLFGKNFNQFLKNVYEHGSFDVKMQIADMAARLKARDYKYGRTIKSAEQYQMDATEEYLAKLAEDTDFERAMNQGWWQQIKRWFIDMCREVGLPYFEGELNDNELRYILWRSYQNLAEPGRYLNMFQEAEAIAKDEEMKRKLGFRMEKERDRLQQTGKTDTRKVAAEAAEPKADLFRDDEEEDNEENDEDNIMNFNAGKPTLEETIISGLMKLARENSDNVQLRIDAMKAIGGNLSKLRQAMSKQRAYDKETVYQIVRLARSIMDNGYIDKLTRGEVKKLMGLIAGAAGKEDITTAAKKVVDMLVGNQLRQVKELLQKQLAIRGTKIDSKGVEVQGQLDIEGVRMARALKEGMTLTEEALAERIDDCLDRMGSADDTISQQAAAEYQGYTLAQQYIDEVRRSESEEANLKYEKKRAREDYDAGRLTKEQYHEFVESIDDTILSNQLERIRGYYDLLANIGDILSRSTKRAREFREKEIAHVREIQHNANSDMEGRAYDEHHKPTWMEKAANWPFVRFFMKPLATFDQMLRLFGSKSVNGEGYLWTRFMNGYTEASDKEWRNLYQDYKDLDKKVSEVFGKDMKWSDLFSIERKMPGMKVEFWDGGERKEHTLTPGNLLYIYMANKMADGRMKLRKMGITEDDVNTIKEHLDPRFIELADWLQNEYLPEKRVYFNSVHEDLFGASMAAIDNYFPLVINKRDLNREEEVGSEDYLDDDKIGATITGNIIKRTKNAKALDITNADAFDVILQHLQQMEHWAAYAAMNKDLGALLSYKHFRNQVLNMKSLQYGSGQNLWVNFKRACAVVSGAYRPKIDKDSVDTSLVNLAKGVTTAKISLRFYTALKQLLSYPAFLSEASLIELAKTTNPYGAVVAWNWAIDNLPGFSKRWQSRFAGDTRLQETDVDWGFWRNKMVKAASKIGLSPNAFVDALTVSMGAKAIYETKKKQYLTDGYSEEQAEKKALNAASISYNETQQSSEGAFVSAMQLDRTVASVALSVFRNSPMAYTRKFAGAIRNLIHMITPGYKGRSVEFMAKQMQRDGLTEQQAERAAKRTYNRSWYKNIADVLIFGYGIQLLWNLGTYIPYLIGGDDDDKKKKMLEDAALHAIAGPIEGLTGGAQMSEIYNIIRSGEDVSSYQFNLLPLMSDLQQTLRHFKSDKVAACNDVINLLIQSGIGVNPQTLTDAFVAIQDAAEGDPETSKEIALLIMRIMQFPQSSIDDLYIDELGISGEEAKKLGVEELSRRWAAYKRRRNAPLTGWAYRDEEEAEVEKKYVDKFTNKIKERFADKSEADLEVMKAGESDEFMKELIQKQLNKMTEATMDEQNIYMIESDFNSTHDPEKRKLMARRIAKSTGASKDPYGGKSDKDYAQLYQELRDAEDVREDAELLKLQEDADAKGDSEKADEISKERQAVRKNIRGMERGETEANMQAMEDLRADRKELLKKYGLK